MTMSRPQPYPDWLDDLWAKSADKGEGGKPESLATHTWLALLRLAELIHLRPTLPEELGKPDLWHLLYWSVFLHDLGKAHPAFQGVLRKQKDAKAIWGAHRHEVLSLPFLSWFGDSLAEEQSLWVIAAILSHHREPFELKELYPPPEEGEQDELDELIRQFSERTLQALWQWLDVCGSAWIKSLHLSSHLIQPLRLMDQAQAVEQVMRGGAAFIRLSLSRYQRWVATLDPSKEEPTLLTALTILRGSVIQADHSASAHAGERPPLQIQPQKILEKYQLAPQNLYDHQRRAAQMVGSTMLIAPTGSGKTESALLWAAGNQRQPVCFTHYPTKPA